MKKTETVQISIQNPFKQTNGDFSTSKFYGEQNTIVLAFADSVGCSLCDWRDSKIACENFIHHFSQSEEIDIHERITKSIDQTNKDVLYEAGTALV